MSSSGGSSSSSSRSSSYKSIYKSISGKTYSSSSASGGGTKTSTSKVTTPTTPKNSSSYNATKPTVTTPSSYSQGSSSKGSSSSSRSVGSGVSSGLSSGLSSGSSSSSSSSYKSISGKTYSSSQVEKVGGTYYVKGTSIPVTAVSTSGGGTKTSTPTTPTYNAAKPNVTTPDSYSQGGSLSGGYYDASKGYYVGAEGMSDLQRTQQAINYYRQNNMSELS